MSFKMRYVDLFRNISNKEKTFITSNTKAVSTSFKYIFYINALHQALLSLYNTELNNEVQS